LSLQDEGFRGPLFLATKNITVPPDSIDDAPEDARSVRTMTTLADRISRPFVFEGQPTKVKKHVWTLKIGPGLQPEAYEHLLYVDALPGTFDLCLWMYEVETFCWPSDESRLPTIAGQPALRSWRQDALRALSGRTPDVIDPIALSELPTKALVDGVADPTPLLGSSDALGRTLWRPSVAPAPTLDTNAPSIIYTYVPKFRVYVDSLSTSLPRGFQVDRTIVLREA
jgi:hypothetical protein